MTISELRAELGLTLAEFAKAVGLASKGQASQIERSAKSSIKVALEIEKLSSGRIKAASLNEDIALIDATRSEAA